MLVHEDVRVGSVCAYTCARQLAVSAVTIVATCARVARPSWCPEHAETSPFIITKSQASSAQVRPQHPVTSRRNAVTSGSNRTGPRRTTGTETRPDATTSHLIQFWASTGHATSRSFVYRKSSSLPPILDVWYISRHEGPMALSVKDPEADRLAREVAARTGETLTQAVVVALRERLARLRGRPKRRRLRDELREIAQRCAQLPTLDDRSDEEILGYDERGLLR